MKISKIKNLEREAVNKWNKCARFRKKLHRIENKVILALNWKQIKKINFI